MTWSHASAGLLSFSGLESEGRPVYCYDGGFITNTATLEAPAAGPAGGFGLDDSRRRFATIVENPGHFSIFRLSTP